MVTKGKGVPPQGSRTPKGRRGVGTVPAHPPSSSSDGPAEESPASSPAEPTIVVNGASSEAAKQEAFLVRSFCEGLELPACRWYMSPDISEEPWLDRYRSIRNLLLRPENRKGIGSVCMVAGALAAEVARLREHLTDILMSLGSVRRRKGLRQSIVRRIRGIADDVELALDQGLELGDGGGDSLLLLISVRVHRSRGGRAGRGGRAPEGVVVADGSPGGDPSSSGGYRGGEEYRGEGTRWGDSFPGLLITGATGGGACRGVDFAGGAGDVEHWEIRGGEARWGGYCPGPRGAG
jgi:hypothetical protein